jgi:hypothetical protein
VPKRRLLTCRGNGLTFRVRVRVRVKVRVRVRVKVRVSMTPCKSQTYLKHAKAHLTGCPLLADMNVLHHPCYFCCRNTMICSASGYGLVRVKLRLWLWLGLTRKEKTRTRKDKTNTRDKRRQEDERTHSTKDKSILTYHKRPLCA